MRILEKAIGILLLGSTSYAQALNTGPGNFEITAGLFSSRQGKPQNIDVQGLIGDHYNVANKYTTKALGGLGYFIPKYRKDNLSIDYGIEAFYLAPTSVGGTKLVEQEFENLSYGYNVRHIPVLLSGKLKIERASSKFDLIIHGGVGTNFTKSSGYKENSLDNGVTIPNDSFSQKSEITLSASVGIGVQIKNIIGKRPVECGYKLLYLGKTSLNTNISIISDNLETGNNYAHAFTCSAAL